MCHLFIYWSTPKDYLGFPETRKLGWLSINLHSKCWPIKTDIFGVVYNSYPIHFSSNSVNISSWSASCPFCVCTEKSAVHTQPWLCKRETNRAAWTKPSAYSHSHVVKCWRFVTTCACAQDNTNAVRYSREFEEALKGGMYLIGCWVQISTSFLQDYRLHL